MKSKVIIGLALVLASSPAYADVYVKVDAEGNAIGGAIMCDAGTCGTGSQYSQLTLQPGEQYVLQSYGQAGVGNNNPDTQVKVNVQTQEWVITTPSTVTTFTPDTTPWDNRAPLALPVIVPVETATSTATTDTATAVATTDTATSIAYTETVTALTVLDEELDLNWDWDKVFIWISAWLNKYWRL